jgi:MAternally-affected-uncoordination protein
MSKAPSAAAIEALLALSVELENEGAYIACTKCLEAVIQRAASLLPLTEVHARLRLALLLMDHSDNAQAAKIHLERGVRANFAQ